MQLTNQLKMKSRLELDKIYQLIADENRLFIQVDSPPGGGKSSELINLALYLCYTSLNNGNEHHNIVILTQSHAQTIDLCKRITFLNHDIDIYGGAGISKTWPKELKDHKQFHILTTRGKQKDEFFSRLKAKTQPLILIINSAKSNSLTLYYQHELVEGFDFGFVDEAYQMRYANFMPSLLIANRWILVGDPGQLKPITSVRIGEYTDLLFGVAPYVPVPVGIEREGIHVDRVKLPVSWRLPKDTTDYIQPVFYRNHFFEGAGTPSHRKLALDSKPFTDSIDRALNNITEGRSLQMLTSSSGGIPSSNDEQTVQLLLETVKRLFTRKSKITDLDRQRPYEDKPIQPSDILILTSRVHQVSSIQKEIKFLYQSLQFNSKSVEEDENDSTSVIYVEDFEYDSHYLDSETMNDENQENSHSPQVIMVNKVYEILKSDSEQETIIDTANRLQGLEGPIVLAIHPCSGLNRFSDFDLEIGRLCVMLSRHRIGCILFSRNDLFDLLSQSYISYDRDLIDDPALLVHEGFEAHRNILRKLQETDRVN